jgi:hypothetical protein
MVYTLPDDRPSGSGRYFPLPVPESRPTEPAGSVDKKQAIIGQGLKDSKMSNLSPKYIRKSSLYTVWMKNGGQSGRILHEHVDLRGLEDRL